MAAFLFLLFQIYGVPHQIANGDGQYAAETTARMLAFYEDYYETEYSMPKMDTAAIPDFLYGAMENWGLNTYRPIFLLYTANVTTEKERGVISHTLAHELGHQWFGNLGNSMQSRFNVFGQALR